MLRLASWAVWTAMAFGLALLVAPGLVNRLRHDPNVELPPVPIELTSKDKDAAERAAVFVEAVVRVVPDVKVSESEISAGCRLTSDRIPVEGVTVSWDIGEGADASVIYVEFEGFADGIFELDPDSDERLAFWLAVGYLRDGAKSSPGRHWVHVREVGAWHPFSASRQVSDFDPEWVMTPPD